MKNGTTISAIENNKSYLGSYNLLLDKLSNLCDIGVYNLILKWLNSLSVSGKSLHTMRSYLSDFISFSQFYITYNNDKLNIDHLPSISVQSFRVWITYRHKNETSNRSNLRAISAIKNFLQYFTELYEETGKDIDEDVSREMGDKINTNTTSSITNILKIKIKHPHQKIPKHVSEEYAQQLCDIDENVKSYEIYKEKWVLARDVAIFSLLYGLGLRISEVLSISKNDIVGFDHYPYSESNYYKLKDCNLIVHGKGNKERVLPIPIKILKKIGNYLEMIPFDILKSDLIFRGVRGDRLNPDVFRKMVRSIARSIGLNQKLSPHVLRHSFATHLVNNGVDIREVQEMLGHSSLSSTEVYMHSDIKNLFETVMQYHPQSNTNNKK